MNRQRQFWGDSYDRSHMSSPRFRPFSIKKKFDRLPHKGDGGGGTLFVLRDLFGIVLRTDGATRTTEKN